MIRLNYFNYGKSNVGAGDCMSRLMYVLLKDAMSYIMMKGGITRPIPLQKFLDEGCAPSPLLRFKDYSKRGSIDWRNLNIR